MEHRSVVYPCHTIDMAKKKIRSTYSLDVETVRKLDRLAEHWKTSKSGALHRAITAVANQAPQNREDAVKALEELQRRMAAAGVDGEKWAEETRKMRRESSLHRLRWLSK